LLEYTSPFSDSHVNAFLTPGNALPILETMTERWTWIASEEKATACELSRNETRCHHALDATPVRVQ
jgi:hypothetical protein